MKTLILSILLCVTAYASEDNLTAENKCSKWSNELNKQRKTRNTLNNAIKELNLHVPTAKNPKPNYWNQANPSQKKHLIRQIYIRNSMVKARIENIEVLKSLLEENCPAYI